MNNYPVHKMALFSYNSNHKIITVIILIAWAIFQFSSSTSSSEKYDNGQVKRIGSVKNGKNQGKWVWYYENGNKKMEGNFLNGKRHGVWTTWYANGKKLTVGNYENDRLNGLFTKYDEHEIVIEQINYKNDVPIHSKSLNDSNTKNPL
ncbi:MAG: hypothetical protein HND54_12635 [Bacteroidetes bacterium]|nr:hypothetical protein [Bacteroidota bacterium]